MHASRVWLHGGFGFLLACGGFLACGSDDDQKQAPSSSGGDASAGESSSMAGVGVGATNSVGGDGQSPGGISGTTGTAGDQGVGGAGGDAATGDDDLGALNAFCKGFAETECAARKACYPDLDSRCVADSIRSCHEYARAEVLPAMKAGLLLFHPERQAACFKLPKAGFCGVNNLWFDADCAAAFSGTASGNTPCFQVYFLGVNLQTCAPGQHCGATPEAVCGSGRCTPYLAEGEACSMSDGQFIPPGCGAKLLCDGATKKCVGEKVLQQACTTLGDPCNRSLPQLFCVPKADGKGGLECDDRRADGAWCGSTEGVQASIACASSVCTADHCAGKDTGGNEYCFSGVCPAGKSCFQEPANPVCRTALTKGKACHTNATECSKELACVAGADPMLGTCQARVAAGGSCSGTNKCVDGLACVQIGDAATCTAQVGKGKPCSVSGECADGMICLSNETCGDSVLVDEACAADADCDGGAYCDEAAATCQPWKRDGEKCARRQECVYREGCGKDGICASMQCTADSL